MSQQVLQTLYIPVSHVGSLAVAFNETLKRNQSTGLEMKLTPQIEWDVFKVEFMLTRDEIQRAAFCGLLATMLAKFGEIVGEQNKQPMFSFSGDGDEINAIEGAIHRCNPGVYRTEIAMKSQSSFGTLHVYLTESGLKLNWDPDEILEMMSARVRYALTLLASKR